MTVDTCSGGRRGSRQNLRIDCVSFSSSDRKCGKVKYISFACSKNNVITGYYSQEDEELTKKDQLLTTLRLFHIEIEKNSEQFCSNY